jgi:HSP20 family protein
MTIPVKQTVLPDFETMERRFRRMFEGLSFMPTLMPVTPAADVYETPEEYVVEVEVPGYEERELGLEVSDHTLTLSGLRNETKDESDKTFRLHERLERTFERTFTLPPEIDSEHITAEFGKGVLKVHAPKLAVSSPRKVAISKS